MSSLIQKIRNDYPGILFEPGDSACWSPEAGKIFYRPDMEGRSAWALLHEIGHVRLNHTSFKSDLDLLSKEVEAWEEAKYVARLYSLEISEEHIQDCLDTYRDWLHRRSKCPACGATGLQQHSKRYQCINCRTTWRVSNSRFCRPYRRTAATK